MDAAGWERVQELFHAALLMPADERERFVISSCGDNQELVETALSMLEADKENSSLLEEGIPKLAYQLLTDEKSYELPPFAEFGPYRPKDKLGQGGMGAVWLADRVDTESVVAVKALVSTGLSPARKELFAAEIRTLAKLEHPYIARLYDAGIWPDGTPWFAMEYVPGIPITQYCRAELSLESKLRLFRSVCEAVQYAHSQEVIHRDLKPSNILVKSDGTPKLLDFGIARKLQQLDDETDSDVRGVRFLSLHYSPPEYIRDGVVGFTTDVYSLGVILYEILADCLPFADEGSADSNGILLEQIPEKPSIKAISSAKARNLASETAVGKGVAQHGVSRGNWDDLDALCLKALHSDAKERYQSVESLIRDVNHFLQAEPLDARPHTVRYRCVKFVKRNLAKVTATAVVVALLVAMATIFTVRLARARNAAIAEAARAERIQHFTLSLFQSDDKVAGAADNMSVVSLVDRGVLEAKNLDQDPKMQADLYQTLGTMYQKLGQLNKADGLLEAALHKREALPIESGKTLADNRIALGLLRADEDKPQEGESLVRQAIQTLAQRESGNQLLMARANSALGQVLLAEGKFPEGVELLEHAAALQEREGAPSTDLAETLSVLAEAYLYQGKDDQADLVNQQLLTLERHIYGNDDPHLSDILSNLGETAEVRGNYARAESYEREGLNIAVAFYGKDHPETASFMTTLAGTLVYESKYTEASQLLQEALTTQEKVYGQTSPQVAYVLNKTGMLAQQQNDFRSAIRDDLRSYEIYRSTYGDGDYRVGLAMANVGSVYLAEKQYAQAEKSFRDALGLLQKERSDDSVDTAVVHIKLGRTLLYESRYREAEKQTRGGYEVLLKQASPQTSFIQAALEDLVKIYDALGQPTDAQKVRDELAKTEKAGTGAHRSP